MKKALLVFVPILISFTFYGQSDADATFLNAWSAKHNSNNQYQRAVLDFSNQALYIEWTNNKIEEKSTQNSYTVSYDNAEQALKISYKYIGDGVHDGTAANDNYDGSVSFGYGYVKKNDSTRNGSTAKFNPFVEMDSIIGSYINMSDPLNRQIRVTYKVKNLSAQDSASFRIDLYDVNDRKTNYNNSSVKRCIKPSSSWQELQFWWSYDSSNDPDNVSGWNEQATGFLDGYSGHWWDIPNGHSDVNVISNQPLVPNGTYPFIVPLDSSYILPKFLVQINGGFHSAPWISGMDAGYLDGEFDIYIKKIEFGDYDNTSASTYTYKSNSTSSFSLSDSVIKTSNVAYSTSVNVNTTSKWTASSNQPWAVLAPTSGTGTGTINIIVTANTADARVAEITVTSNGISKIIQISQDGSGVSQSIVLTAGQLSADLTSLQLNAITNLTITGTIDARDFKVLNSMPFLSNLDLSAVTIVAYLGNDASGNSNELPQSAFLGNGGLTSIKLSSTTTIIGNSCFANCSALQSITIPSSITTIGDSAFVNCSNLTSISIFNQTIKSNLKSVLLPSMLTYIGKSSFENCVKIDSISIPSSVSIIGGKAFSGCVGLSAITVNQQALSIPLSSDVFTGVNKNSCILYVPCGYKNDFKTAVVWGEFKSLIEYGTTSVLASSIGDFKIFPNPASKNFSINVEGKAFIQIVSSNGLLIEEIEVDGKEPIYVDNISKGMYFIKIQTKETVVTKRLIIQ